MQNARHFLQTLRRAAAPLVVLGLLQSFGAAARDDRTVLHNVTVIDPSAPSPESARRPGQTIIFDQRRILEIRPAAERPVEGANVVDGTGKFVVPAFWDMHAHVPQDAGRARAVLQMQLANGVLHMRDMGTDMPLDELKRLVADSASQTGVGARIVATPYRIAHGRDGRRANADEQVFRIENAADARTLVRFARAHRLDFLKPYDSISRDAYHALMREAGEAGIPVSGHIPRAVAVDEAVALGQSTVEHAQSLTWACAPAPDRKRRAYYLAEPQRRFERNLAYPGFAEFVAHSVDMYDPSACATLMNAMATAGVHYVPTLVTRRFDVLAAFREYRNDPLLAYVDPGTRHDWAVDAKNYAALPAGTRVGLYRFLLHAMKITADAHRAGVPILVGSDAPDSYIFPGFSYHLEMEMLVEAGLPPLAVLEAATIGAARFMREEARRGTVVPGKLADFILLDADPVIDIGNTRRIHAVVAGGNYLDRAELDRRLASARQTASAPSSRPSTGH